MQSSYYPSALNIHKYVFLYVGQSSKSRNLTYIVINAFLVSSLTSSGIQSYVQFPWQRSAVIELYKAFLNCLSPNYMQYMFTLNKNNHNLCSDNKILLPKCHTTNFGLKSFAYQAGSLWNKLPNSY